MSRVSGSRFSSLRHLPAVEAWHHDVKRDGKGLDLPRPFHRSRRIRKADHVVSLRAKVTLIERQHLRIVIDGEDHPAAIDLGLLLLYPIDGQCEVESATLADAAMHADASRHADCIELLADRQPQARAAGLSRRRIVNLRKGLEELGLIFLRDTVAGVGRRLPGSPDSRSARFGRSR